MSAKTQLHKAEKLVRYISPGYRLIRDAIDRLAWCTDTTANEDDPRMAERLQASIDDAVQEIEGLTAAVNAAKAAQVEVGCVLRKKAAK